MYRMPIFLWSVVVNQAPTPRRFGPMVPVAPGMPGMIWQAPQPFCWIRAAPAAGSAPAGAGAGAGGAGAGDGWVAGAAGAGEAPGLTAATGDGTADATTPV